MPYSWTKSQGEPFMTKIKAVEPLTVIAIIAILFVILITTLYFGHFSSSFSTNQADWAGFGSYIGGTLGTVFAFASFWILFYTFGTQQKQAKNNELQKFETTFYSLLELHNQSLRELDIDINKLKIIFRGNQTPKSILVWSIADSKLEQGTSEADVNNIIKYRLKKTQESILEEVELSQYFRILYQLLKFVSTYNICNTGHRFDDEYLDNEDSINVEYEKMYTSLVRGFVPVKLLPILAINCIPTGDGLHNLDKYKKLLDRYEFLEHIQLKELPKNPTTFLILQSYSRALGKNKEITTKIEGLKLRFPYLFAFKSTKKGYVSK